MHHDGIGMSWPANKRIFFRPGGPNSDCKSPTNSKKWAEGLLGATGPQTNPPKKCNKGLR
jgi:hypothetical protein